MSPRRPLLVVFFAGLVGAGVVLSGWAATPARGAAPAAPTEQAMAPYLTPQHEVPIGPGRTINLVCLGHGSPTVILSAGLEAWSLWWGRVQPSLAKHTRVCAWDRAGYGFSSASPDRRTSFTRRKTWNGR